MDLGNSYVFCEGDFSGSVQIIFKARLSDAQTSTQDGEQVPQNRKAGGLISAVPSGR